MTYIATDKSAEGTAKVIYDSKDGKISKTFDPDWLAQPVWNIPNRREQTVFSYSFYSNKSRCLRKKAATDVQAPMLIESDILSNEFRKNWTRLIEKIYNFDPLVCSRCMGSIKIIYFIEEDELFGKILEHLGLWEVNIRTPPRANSPFLNIHIDYTAAMFFQSYRIINKIR